jgi:DNA-binding SARP family transcriptional activator
MSSLSVTLLGGFHVRSDAGPLTVPTRKAQALLAYLAVPAGHPHPRDKLASLLWGDTADEQARNSFRQALSTLRKALPPGSLVAEAETVALDPAAAEVDVAVFERRVAEATPGALAEAAALYQGDLLAGLALKEAPFEEWLLSERERLRELALEGLAKLLAHRRSAGQTEPAIQTGLKLLTLDPLQEPVHRMLMRLYAEAGRRGAALRQYQQCVAVLQRELDVEPEAETKQLYQEIIRRAAASPGQAAPGKARPEPTRRWPSTGRSAGVTTETPLIGRDAELATLRSALAEVVGERGHVVAVLGEAGVGKTRLLVEVATEARQGGCHVLFGRAFESAQILPFGPWVDAFRAGGLIAEELKVGALDPVWRAELARLFPELAAPGLPAPGDDYLRLFESVAHLVARVAATQPLVLMLEDLHWADEMSVRLLSFLGRRVATWPVLVVATAREEELADADALRRTFGELRGEGHFAELPLSPLSRPDTSRLVRCLTTAGSGTGTIEWVEEKAWATSEGNPFVVVETVRALREGLTLQEPATLSVPQRVLDVIAGRVARLSEASRHLLSVAAVIGREFDFALLQRASGLPEREAAGCVEELVRRRMLHGVDEGFDFTHQRIREVVYAGLLPPRRKLLHSDVAVALEALTAGALDPPAGALGMHYRHAEVPRKAQVWLTTAGDMAARKYATGPANHYYEAALAIADTPLDRASLHERIGDMYMRQWSGDAGGIHHRRGLELWRAAGAPDASMGARLYAKLAEAPTRWRGAFKTPPAESEVIRWIEAGLDLLRDAEPSIEKARLLMARAQLPNFTGRHDEEELRQAIASAEEALPIMEVLGTAHDVSAVLDAIGSAHTGLADYPRSLACHLRRRDLGPLIDDRAELIDIGCMLSRAYSALGRYADAVREAQAAADLGEIGLGGWHVHALLWRTWAHFAGDQWDDATRSFEEFLGVWESYGRIYQTFVGELFLIQAVVLARRGEEEKASALARQAENYVVRRMLHLPALLLMAQDRLADARVVLEELAGGRGRLNPAVPAHLAEIQAKAGDPRAAAASDQVLAFATRAGTRKEIAQAHRVRGIVLGSAGQWSTAEEHFAEALRRYQELGTRWEVARTLREWGRAALHSEDPASHDHARERLGGALAIFREFGDRRSAEDVQAMLA